MKTQFRDAVSRKEKILDLLVSKGSVRVGELSELLGASSVTIRNDLSELQEKGMLSRTHGGAVMREKAYLQISRSKAMMRNAQKKATLAAACARYIQDNDTFLVNAGTTAACVIKELSKRRGLTMLTNSILAAQEAAAYDSIDTIVLGGRYERGRQYTYGDDTASVLDRYMADKAILSVDGISDGGLTTQRRDECAISRLMVERAHTTIVVADSSKIGRTALSYIAPVGAVSRIITNADADEHVVRGLRAQNVEVELI